MPRRTQTGQAKAKTEEKEEEEKKKRKAKPEAATNQPQSQGRRQGGTQRTRGALEFHQEMHSECTQRATA